MPNNLSALLGEKKKKKEENLVNQYGANKFQYTPETDPNYQAYMKLAKENAGLAMQDTLAKASAMTGGYSNSNAQLAGQKVYNQHLSEAEGRVGDYYAMALDTFNTNQNTLLNQIELARAADRDKQNNLLNMIEMAWAAEDRDIAAQNRLRENALLKAEYGDYSGLTDLGISQEAADKYKENADWATQYSKDQAAFERAWQVAEATGDYTTFYKQLGYTDEQIAALQGSIDDKKYADTDWIDREYNVSIKGYNALNDLLSNVPGVNISTLFDVIVNDKATDKRALAEVLSYPFVSDARTGTIYTLGETIDELEKSKLTKTQIIEFLTSVMDNAEGR